MLVGCLLRRGEKLVEEEGNSRVTAKAHARSARAQQTTGRHDIGGRIEAGLRIPLIYRAFIVLIGRLCSGFQTGTLPVR